MPHYCWMCGRERANEKFSGRGHRDHICHDCQKLPAAERAQHQAVRDMWQMREQSRISGKNAARLRALADSPSAEVSEMAAALLEVASVHPGRRNRLRQLRKHPELWARMVRLGLLDDEIDEWAANSGEHFAG